MIKWVSVEWVFIDLKHHHFYTLSELFEYILCSEVFKFYIKEQVDW